MNHIDTEIYHGSLYDISMRINSTNANYEYRGKYLIRYAIEYNRLPIVKYLVKVGSSVLYEDILCSFRLGHHDISLYLLSITNFNVGKYGYELLINACKFNNIDIIKMLVEKGVNVNTCYDGHTPLTTACDYANDVQIVKYLLDKGASDSYCNYKGTPLGIVCRNGNLDIVKLLLDRGASMGSDHNYALRIAIYYDHIDIVKLLVLNGADIYHEYDGKTILQIAKQNKQIAKFLNQYIASETNIFMACKLGNMKALASMLTSDTVNSKDKQGRSLIYYAQENGHKEIYYYIVRYIESSH